MTQTDDRTWCKDMLPKVSRTFAACIGLLPPPLDEQVLIAYLLCRIADTIEDDATRQAMDKDRLLACFEAALADPETDVAAISLAFAQPRDDDQLLTREAPRTLRRFHAQSPAVRTAIRPWVVEMSRGMAAFATEHPQADPEHLVALDSLRDLDRYCYFVAGTVGHLLSDLFYLHSDRIDARRHGRLRSLATSFGLGLQLTNIIKDVADDRRRGWSFIPRDLCRAHHTSPEAFLDAEAAPSARACMDDLIAKTTTHLHDALAYSLHIPASEYRMRLFCLTPLYFAVRTLSLAQTDRLLLDPDHKVKITRREVHRTIAATRLVAPCDRLVREYFRRLATDLPAPGRRTRQG